MWINNRPSDVGLHWTDLHRWVALMVSQAGVFGDECLVSVIMKLTWNDGVADATRTAQVLIYGSDLTDLVALRRSVHNKKTGMWRHTSWQHTYCTSKYTPAQTPTFYTFLIHPHKHLIIISVVFSHQYQIMSQKFIPLYLSLSLLPVTLSSLRQQLKQS